MKVELYKHFGAGAEAGGYGLGFGHLAPLHLPLSSIRINLLLLLLCYLAHDMTQEHPHQPE